MDEQTLRLLQRLRLNNLALTGRLRANLDAQLTARWMGLDSWRDDDITRLLNEILPLVSAAERQMVDTTNAYIASTQATAAGSAFRPRPIRYQDLTGAALRGVDPSVVFRRPQMVMNYRLSKGASLSDAIDAGANRLRSLGATNLQLAKTKTVAVQGQSSFYRRVLTGSENCALCVIASTQRYRRGKLAPIHPGCDCGIEEIIEAQPPHVIDSNLLELTHTEINARLGGTDRSAQDLGRDKRDARDQPLSDFTDLIVVREHGELGPTLAWRGDRFRGPAEAADLAA